MSAVCSTSTTSLDTARAIEQATITFTTNKVQALSVSQGLEICEIAGRRFFGIAQEIVTTLDFGRCKALILHHLNLDPSTNIVQILGDSQCFSVAGTTEGRAFLEQHLSKENQLIQWGLIGRGSQREEIRNANQIAAECIAKKGLHGRAIANVVASQTVKAIKAGACQVPENTTNFILLQENASLSDRAFWDSIVDEALVLEGGIETFQKIVNLLEGEVEVRGLYNLRGPVNPATFSKTLNHYVDCFSASEFLHLLKLALIKFSNPEKAGIYFIEQFKVLYLKDHLLCNPDLPDAEAQEALFETAWNQFIEQKLWLKLDNCFFRCFKDQPLAINHYVKLSIDPSARHPKPMVILTGGPESGKKSIINRLAMLGENVIHESATEVVRGEYKTPESTLDQRRFSEQIVALQVQGQKEAQNKLRRVFFNRSPIDTLSFCLHMRMEPPPQLVAIVQEVVKNNFYFPTLFLIENRSPGEKGEVSGEFPQLARKLQEDYAKTYQALGFNVVRVPRIDQKPVISLELRTRQVLDECDKSRYVAFENADKSGKLFEGASKSINAGVTHSPPGSTLKKDFAPKQRVTKHQP